MHGRLGALVLAGGLFLAEAACGPPYAHPTRAGTRGVPGYRVLRDVPMPGRTDRWDYQAYDAASHRLWLADLGAGEVVVFDTLAQKVVGVVQGTPAVHGVALAPDLGLAYAAEGNTDQVAIIDTRTLTVVRTVAAGVAPNGIAYAPGVERVFVSDAGGLGDTVLDARSGRMLARLPLGAEVGNTKFDGTTGEIYVSLGLAGRLVAVDPASGRVTRSYRLSRCDAAHGVQLDVGPRHRAFVACLFNRRLEVVDLTSGRVTQLLGTGGTPDVLALDPVRSRLYVASESGQLAVFDVSGQRVRKLAQGLAGPDAHTVSIDPGTGIVYLPLASLGGVPVLRELIAAG
ncbi:MAG: YncE family protein [Candidatus Dormibacterales bacterium]